MWELSVVGMLREVGKYRMQVRAYMLCLGYSKGIFYYILKILTLGCPASEESRTESDEELVAFSNIGEIGTRRYMIYTYLG